MIQERHGMCSQNLGLHGLLKSIQKPCHLKKFSGQTLGVDAYGWLHRGTVACSVDLVLDRPTRKLEVHLLIPTIVHYCSNIGIADTLILS